MKLLITGAAGFLGAAVIARLEDECDLTLADLHPRDEGSGRWRTLDVTDLDAVREVVRGHDAVVHMVALVRGRAQAELRTYVDTMVLGTWAVAEACALEGVGRLVNVSSVAADGYTEDCTRQRRVGDPAVFAATDRFYAIAKHLGEAIVRAYGVAFPIATLNLRPGVIAGDGENPDPRRPEDDTPYWFVHVDARDVADGIARALASDATGTYHLVAGRGDTRWEWESAAQAFGYAPEHNWQEL